MGTGLLRLLLIFFGFVLLRRVWKNWMRSLGLGEGRGDRARVRRDGSGSPASTAQRPDLDAEQPIEEADYEELD